MQMCHSSVGTNLVGSEKSTQNENDSCRRSIVPGDKHDKEISNSSSTPQSHKE